MKRKKILVENKIPYMKGLLEPWADVDYMDPNFITRSAIKGYDALLVRTRTKCNEQLLEGSDVEFIGTATIGTDHIDMDYCQRKGITVRNAPGCNAPAVAQWVLSTIGHWMQSCRVTDARGIKLGVVGVGHVGRIVARWACEMGFSVILNDPPLGLHDSVDGCDIITFHTPLTRDGQWPTWHMCDDAMLSRLTDCRLILNASRGAVCDNEALLRWGGDVAIDCWENEPDINRELLESAFVATPHIAGYSLQGKMRGTAMMVQAVNEFYGFDGRIVMPSAPLYGVEHVTLKQVMDSYNPLLETTLLRKRPEMFEHMRNVYVLRPEVE